MTTVLYFHSASSTVGGTLPTSTQSGLTINKDVDAETVNRSMTTTIGAGQTSLVLTSNASASAQTYYFTKFVSRPLAAQTISANTWTYKFGAQESNANANFPTTTTGTVQICLYVWRPSNGTKVGNVLIGASASGFAEASTSESAISGTFSGSSVSAANGDVLIMEIIFTTTQGNATARTDTFYYDGTTTDSTSTNAAQISTPQNLVFGFAASLTETITISDSIDTLRGRVRTLTETITISDTVSRAKIPSTIPTVYGTMLSNQGDFGNGISAGGSGYIGLGDLFTYASETNAKKTFRTAGTMQNLYINANTNTLSSTITFTFRNNGADGNQTVSIPPSTTGLVQDTTHSDSISAGDQIAIRYSAGAGTGSMNLAYLAVNFDTGNDTNTVTRLWYDAQAYNYTGGSTLYAPITGGNYDYSSITTESDTKTRIRKTGTIKNLAIQISSSTLSVGSTITSRKNAADGNLTISVPATSSGWFEDTTHSDSTSPTDDYNYKIASSGTGQMFVYSILSDYTTTGANIAMLSSRVINARTQASNLTKYYSPINFNFPSDSASELSNAVVKVVIGRATFQELTIGVPTNTVNGTSTLTFRSNQNDTSLAVSISSSSTGTFSDSSDTVNCYGDDLVGHKLVTGGSSGTMTVAYTAIWYEVYRPITVVAPLYLQPVFTQWIDS